MPTVEALRRILGLVPHPVEGTPDTFSAMPRLASNELFHFYLGDPVEMLPLHPGGTHQITVLSPDLEAGQRPQVLVPRDT